MQQLLTEYFALNIAPSQIQESLNRNGGKLIVQGVIQRKNAKNQNGRIYPGPILEREVQRYMNEIKNRTALGELDHSDQAIINLKNTSHLITEVVWRGDDLLGTIEILPTPSGNIAKNLIESGVKVGISSRGMGSVKQIDENTVEVEDDFQLTCWDLVSNPSTHGAFVKPLNEGVSQPRLPKYYNLNKIITNIITTLP